MRTVHIDQGGKITEVPVDIGRHLIATGAAKAALAADTEQREVPPTQADLQPDPVANKPKTDKPARKGGPRDEGSAAASS